MTSLTRHTLENSRGLTYTYYTAPAAQNKPTLLLLHGYPDCAAEWNDLADTHLVPAGYGVVAPDLLGYAGTSKPTDPAAYKWGLMVTDIKEILDVEKISKVVVLGHDWGSYFAQKVYNLAPERTEGLALINVAYSAPSNKPFDLDGYLALTTKAFGYGVFWYWKLFTHPDGAKIVQQHLNSNFDALHVPGEGWVDLMCQPDGLKDFLERDGRAEVQSYATEEMRKAWVERMEKDGMEAPFCWYKAQAFGHQDGEANEENAVVNVPTLFVGFDKDFVCRPELIGLSEQKGLLPKLTKVQLEGSHWGLLDKKKEFGEAVVGWLERTYSAPKL